MAYYNYHAIAKTLIKNGKLIECRILDEYKGVSPALLLIFDDNRHPAMPIKKDRWEEYFPLVEKYLKKPHR